MSVSIPGTCAAPRRVVVNALSVSCHASKCIAGRVQPALISIPVGPGCFPSLVKLLIFHNRRPNVSDVTTSFGTYSTPSPPPLQPPRPTEGQCSRHHARSAAVGSRHEISYLCSRACRRHDKIG